MAVSDDGASLWIGYDERYAIRKFSVAGTPPVAGPSYSLPMSGTTNSTASDLVPLPGAPTSIAACTSAVGTTRVAVLDDGVARGQIVTARLSNLAAGPAGTLFGYEAQSSGFNFTSFAVDAGGVTMLGSPQGGLLGGFSNDIHYHQGRVYADGGEVIDVSNAAQPFRIGRFAYSGVVTARSANRLLMLGEGPIRGSLLLRVLETDNFTQVATLSLGKNFSEGATFRELHYIGGDAVAFLSDAVYEGRSVFIFRSPALAAPP
jgi:hypothetical protein